MRWISLFEHQQSEHTYVGEQENISMFSTCLKLTPRAPIPDGRMEQIMQPCHGVIALCKLPTFWCLCFQCWSRPNFPTLCDQLHYHSEVHSELKIWYYCTPNIKVTLLLNYLRPYENNPNAWDGLTPYSTYLYLDFNLCSMTKLKEHSREIC